MTAHDPAHIAESVRWDTTRCMVGTGVAEDVEKLTDLLDHGWEPFAVTAGGSAGYVYHFRRPMDTAQYDGAVGGTDE